MYEQLGVAISLMGPMRGAKGGPCCLPPPPPRPHIHSSFPLHFTSGPHPTRVHKAASEGKGSIKIGDDFTAGSVSQVIRGAVNL